MGYRWLPVVTLLAVGCGSHPSPGPSPVPQPVTVHATLTDTVSGASIAVSEQAVSSLPARLTFTAPGHLGRTLMITAAAPTVDLIPDAAPFDLTFYRQFARGSLEGPIDQLRVLSQAPRIYLQRTGLTDANVAALEQAARDVIPALTGGRFQLAGWQVGETLPADAAGVITVEIVTDASLPCGNTTIGAAAGHMRLSIATRCLRDGAVSAAAFAHEVGHGLGFWHVESDHALMRASLSDRLATDTTVSAAERYHAAIAYHRTAGNTDVDTDP